MEKRQNMTVQQETIYNGIISYQKLYGFAPSIRELCDISGLSSTSSVYAHLKRLEEMGYIRRRGDAPRAIAVL